MQLPITRIDPTLPLPQYATTGAAAFDLYARERTEVPPKQVARIPTNLIVRIPDGYVMLICSRSSTPTKKGLSVPHGIGVIDRDYCGSKDELLAQVYNFTDQPVTVERGERIAQAMVLPVASCAFVETAPATESRGGFGSTG